MNKKLCESDAKGRGRARPWMQLWRASAVALLTVALQGLLAPAALAQPTVAIAQTPLLALKTAPGLVMLTMSRDHRLFYAAYNDTSDLNGDGVVDVGFNPSITYYGNFVSNRCYDYITRGTNNPLFRPIALTTATVCRDGATQRWNGNWLNWAATSRMDALRRVLYGGYRVVDSAVTAGSPSNSSTVLQAAYIPKDSHVWGKELRPSRDSYDITQYTRMPTPAAGTQHLLVVVKDGTGTDYSRFLTADNAPVLRYILNANETTERIWTWASADVAQGIGTNPANFTKGGGRASVAATADLVLRAEACAPIGGVREAGCTGYPIGSASPTTWKPTGVLHDYAANDTLKFGLLTGSYQNNYSGGVLRQNIRSFKEEIDRDTGRFGLYNTVANTFTADNSGIARTIDRIAIHGWQPDPAVPVYDCGYNTTGNRLQGQCKSWGAPIAEMMYEGLRYFSGQPTPTSAYHAGVELATSADRVMGFTAPPAWLNPYRAKLDGGSPICSRPVQMVIADPLTSFDSDQLPGARFTSAGGFGAPLAAGGADLVGFNVTTESDAVWNGEALGTRNVYIGQSGTLYDGNPTAKSASGFSEIIGHAPDETQSRGGYYSAGVARFGRVTGVPIGAPTGYPIVVPRPTTGPQKVDTISVALGSLTPTIEFTAAGRKISIVPLSKAVARAGINKEPTAYQATGAITGFYYASATPTSVSAVVNFSDGDQGTDNETDAQVRYDITLSGSSLTVQMTQMDRTPGGIESHLGYVISGTTKDGLYLETRTNTNGTPEPISLGEVYYLDTRPGFDPPLPPYASTVGQFCDPVATANPPPGVVTAAQARCIPSWDRPTSRTFTVGVSAASAGGFIPQDTLWYAAKYGGSGDIANGNPTNYFKVTNPTNLPEQMGKAFRSAAALAAVASTSVVGVGQRSLGSAAIYQANYDSLTWSSRLYAFRVQNDGTVSDTTLWEASSLIGAPSTRTRLFLGRGGAATPWPLTSGGYGTLSAPEQSDFGSAVIYEYLLGDKTQEQRSSASGTLRNRGSTATGEFGSVLGDIVNSDPQIITRKDYGYGASDAGYAAFLPTLTTESLAVGTNNGFFHIFDAAPNVTGGTELFGFIPQAARTNIKDLASPSYQHRYFVDGAIGQGHAKIPVPGDGSTLWRSVAVAAGGAGAKTVFAINTTTQSYSGNSVLWEINENTTLPFPGTLGNVMGRPAIGKLANGTWVAIFGNGYNSTAGTATLFVVRLQDGFILKEIKTNDAVANNGLGSTEIVKISTGFQDTIEYVYGADYKGNIWRFDLRSVDINAWPTTAALIYTSPTNRPITAEIKIGPATGHAGLIGKKMVYFGTGTYLNAADTLITSPSQALYGIYDDLISTTNATPAVTEADLAVSTLSMVVPNSDTRTTSIPSTPWYNQVGKKGWTLAFAGTNIAPGERVIAPPVRYTVAGRVDAFLFTSIVPGTDDCVAGIDAWITGIDAMTGGYAQVFDGLGPNSIKITGGSPRGVFVLQDGGDPSLYISQTIFNGNITTTSFTTSTGGNQSVTINGTLGQTRVLGVKLVKPTPAGGALRQVWRQLK